MTCPPWPFSALTARNSMTPTDYMVEKSYNLAQYLGPLGAYLMPQGPK